MFKSTPKATIIAEGFKIIGNVETEGSVELNGEIVGELLCSSVTIFPTARVAGSIKAEHVTVDGNVEGPIHAGEVTLKSRARVLGDVECESLSIQKGASLEGRFATASEAKQSSDVVKPLRAVADSVLHGRGTNRVERKSTQ